LTGLTREQAAKVIRRVLSNPGGRIFPAWPRLEKGRDPAFDMADVQRVLRDFEVLTEPLFDEKSQSFSCEIKGRDIEGETLVVLVAVSEENASLTIINGHGE